MSHPTPNLSVVVLAYRSGEALRGFVDSLIYLLDREEPEWELVLVANHFSGDGDKTPEIVKQLAESSARIKAITQIKKGMMGWDMRSGLEAATGKTLAVIDGDGQMPCEDVIRVYRKLISERLELVKTYRLKRDDGPYRKTISVVYNMIFKTLFPGLMSRDISCLINRPSFVRVSSIFEFLGNLVRFRIMEYGYWFKRNKSVLNTRVHEPEVFKHSSVR